MTTAGQAITTLYSLIVITVLMILDLKRLINKDKGGWMIVCLVPVFILLVNII
ncbi:hypothetical protein MHI65_002469 [Clostridium botulinum]|uniref:hypothetical protein n=1 Tax=Clostridium botulinum TaxID=1491 RepID=UPI001C9AFF1C|nr:hypothetical protein [Clostridium botulinum]MBY6879688.1 hypothetical protein [Clostridium botulinum]WCJ72115.1 hypothetical protein MHB86_002469 [Clostridium botulinum]WCJ75954.1 hypothetical protein MHI66_002469 [Clostridium botulinum]WCJ79793.1 hypothetical protein MHI65_002469 [Clostridium botulinum]